MFSISAALSSNNMAAEKPRMDRSPCQCYNQNASKCSRDVPFQLDSSLEILVVHLIFQLHPPLPCHSFTHSQKKSRNEIWRKSRPIHTASRMLWIFQGNNTIIEMFVEETKDLNCSMLMVFILHVPRGVLSLPGHFVSPQIHAECPNRHLQ